MPPPPTPGAGVPGVTSPPPTGKAKPGAVEHVMTHANGVQYEIPVYKYDALFKPLEELLEKPPAPAAKKK
jgi:hypothetical protein